MKKKILSLVLIATVAIVGVLFATDNVSLQSGVVRSMGVSRWATARVATTTTSLTSVTNIVATVPTVVNKLVIVPGSTNDAVYVYNSKTTAGCTAANEVYVNTAAKTVGLPVIYDLSPGLDCSTGLTVVTVPEQTNLVVRTFIEYDSYR